MSGPTPRGLGHPAAPRVGRRFRAVPLRALRESLEVARAAGLDFESAWEPSVEGALTGYRGRLRSDWSSAIGATREVWRSAYVGDPPNRRLERWAGVLQPL
jgi:hypothetical protein